MIHKTLGIKRAQGGIVQGVQEDENKEIERLLSRGKTNMLKRGKNELMMGDLWKGYALKRNKKKRSKPIISVAIKKMLVKENKNPSIPEVFARILPKLIARKVKRKTAAALQKKRIAKQIKKKKKSQAISLKIPKVVASKKIFKVIKT